MVCGTASDSGKSTVVTGLCRLLARRGLRVAPFKAQNMALNSAVTDAGQEIGRAQAAQAQAAGVAPEAAMNPILLKPSSDRRSQVMVMGQPWAVLDAAGYQAAKGQLWPIVLDALEDLRGRFDVIVCEGAGSPAEINLLEADIVNLRVAVAAGFPAVLVGDIDRGGVFAAMFGTVELLPPELRATVKGFVINKFRGDPALLASAPADLARRTRVPTLGVLPWLADLGIDAEDSLALRHGWPARVSGASSLDVAVVRFPRISNFTDVDALAIEAGVAVRSVDSPGALGRPDLLILPGTKATVADLEWMRGSGLADAIEALVAEQGGAMTVLGICGGYQMLGRTVEDAAIESERIAAAPGLGLLPVRTVFQPEKLTRRVRGMALGNTIEGYEIRHGRTAPDGAWVELEGGGPEGSRSAGGGVVGTSVHGLFESDPFRAAFLSEVADRAGKAWTPSGVSFAALRESRFDRLADAIEEHLDVAAIDAMLEGSGRPAAVTP
jgi:adenosylcobyric acid synthase